MQQNDRGHFIVDIHWVFNLLGKRYFLIFYLGRHLHPRQRELTNQHVWGNRFVFLLMILLVLGAIYGLTELVAYRLAQG
ncbi:MAG: hypothetical protein OQJ99_11745 [Rhodospirillales bacterium]|nr:hypothetical protein [Rhodospirillales bacterium]MCW8860814.1 hypothetical protein [Rhodospirillales bacterium]MCW9002250.1 hypothetical protein [Rhodospirillales bacterium]MCW9039853.1 hypothetical protein [Rhodospirillales bacterium]